MTSVETVPTTTERPYPTYPTLSTASAATLLNELVIFQADPAKTSTETDENPFSVIAADILPLSVNWETATKKLTILLSRAQSTEKQCLLESIFERVAFFPSIYSQDQLQARKAFDAVLMQHTTIDILPTDQVIDWQYAIVRLHERVSNINPEYKEQLLISLLDQSRSLDQQLRLRRINIPITAHEQISAWKQEYAQRVADKNAFDRVLSAFIAEKLLPLNKNVNWKDDLATLNTVLKKADTALAGQIANKVAERLQSMFYYLDLNSVGFVKYVVTLSEYITEPRELVSPLQLVETFSNLSIDFNDMSAQRVQRQAEKHIVNIVQILRPELVVAIGGEVKPTTFQAAIKQVIRQFAGMILEKGGLGTKDIYDNSTFFVSLAKALVEEFNLTKKDADISDIAGVIQAELSVSDENIPERRFAGNKGGFNYAMPQLIADTDRLTYQDEARLFTPATIAKLLGVSVDQFLKDAKYEQLIQLVSTFLPAIANPYDGHRVINNRPSPLG